ncbi:PAS domain-containing protein [Neorhizobium sp. P12A]|uniref:PAS domain-containing protein n=1 Tax=Neorhizobium sp. P12A TaxID=2268027 RepID=UPI0011EE381D|nr:PAS domain-containing protein [Neorhizobium sp. P12A]
MSATGQGDLTVLAVPGSTYILSMANIWDPLMGTEVDEPGIWIWSIDEDLVYGDTTLARLFGLDPTEAIIGLPSADYLIRIHADDRERVAREVTDAVVTGSSYFAAYRVRDYLGMTRRVIALGRCFRNRAGHPVQCAGITYPVDLMI